MLVITHAQTLTQEFTFFFFAHGTELQVLQAEVLTKGRFGAFVLES